MHSHIPHIERADHLQLLRERANRPLEREVGPARSWFLEIAAVWAAIGALAYAGYTVIA